MSPVLLSVYALDANWAITWGVGKGGIAVRWLMSVFEEIFDRLIKILIA
jgi:hypothetical protein